MVARKSTSTKAVPLSDDTLTVNEAVEYFRARGIPDVNKRKVWYYIESQALKAYRRRSVLSGRPYKFAIRRADADAFLKTYTETAVPAAVSST